MARPTLQLILFRGPHVLLDLSAVVDDDTGLEAAGQSDELVGLPVVLALATHPFRKTGLRIIRIIKPQHVDFSVIRQQFTHLIAHVLGVAVHIAAL